MLVSSTMGIHLASSGPRELGSRGAALLLLAACASSGCATIGLTSPRFEDSPVRTTKEQVPAAEGRFVSIEQTGPNVSLAATRACDVRESTTVRRRTRSERVNRSAALDWTFGALGAGLAASGAVVLVDSSKVYPNDTSARQYNPLGPTGARLVGGSLAAAGAALATIALVDVARSSGEDVSTELMSVPGAFVERGVRCNGIPLTGAAVLVTLPKERAPFDAGVTGPDGRLAINLDAVVPADTVFRKDAHADVTVAGESVGKVELASLYSARDGLNGASSTDHPALTPTPPPLAHRFLVTLNATPTELTRRRRACSLAGAEPRLAALRDEEAWGRTGDALATCSAGKPEDLELECTFGPFTTFEQNGVVCETSINQNTTLVRAPNADDYGTQRGYIDCCAVKDGTPKGPFRDACSALRSYVTEFPKGRHVADAANAIKTGDAALEKWRAARTKHRAQELAAEDAKEKREAEEKKAEERKEAAKQKQAKSAEAERQRRACAGTCKMHCSTSDAFRYQTCLDGCVESNCQ